MNHKSEVLALFLVACAVEGSVHAAEWHVRAGAYGTGSLENPAGTIQYAVNLAADNDTIRVTEGTYSQPVMIVGKSLVLEGGWNSSFTERHPENHLSIIAPSDDAATALAYWSSPNGELSGFTVNRYLRCWAGSSPLIRNNVVVSLDCTASSPLITQNVLGSGSFRDSASVITDNVVTGPLSSSGPTAITSNTVAIVGNTVTGKVSSSASTGTIIGNTIAGGMTSSSSDYSIIAGNTITARDWYGIRIEGQSASIVTGNTVTLCTPKGGISCSFSFPTIANNLIARNNGGGIVCEDRATPTIVNNTVVGNNGAWGYGGGLTVASLSSPTVLNCIFRGNPGTPDGHDITVGTPLIPGDASLLIRYCVVPRGHAGVYLITLPYHAYLTWGPGNLDTDPLFADAANGDYHLKSAEGRWNPNASGGTGAWVLDDVTSPCVNGGDPASDYSKEPFPHGRRVNVGAYGNTPEASKGTWILPGDANGDSRVDVLDLISIRNLLGSPTSPTGDTWWADVNMDGKVNVLDLIFVRNRLATKRE